MVEKKNYLIVKYSNLSKELKEQVFQLKLDFKEELDGQSIDLSRIESELKANVHFVSMDKGKPVGFIQLVGVKDGVELTGLYVSKKRRGIGSKLVARAVGYARAKGVPLNFSHQTHAGRKHFLKMKERYETSRRDRDIRFDKQRLVFVKPERTLQTPSVHFRRKFRKPSHPK